MMFYIVNGLIIILFIAMYLIFKRMSMNPFKVFAFSIAISCLALMMFDQILFATGTTFVYHYTPFGEWFVELPMTVFALVYLTKYGLEVL